MHKSKEQQKDQRDYQMTLFDKHGEPHHDAGSGTTGYQGGGVDYLSQLTRQRTLTTTILEEILDYGNLNRAYKQVSANGGSGGIDKMDTKELRQWLGEHINTLRTGIMTNGLVEQRIAGTPQGSPLSPLLSNIVLDELDREFEKRGLSFCRYADDCNIFVGSRKAGERVLASLTDFIGKKLKLKVNRDKSGVRHCSDVKFLGYTLLPEGKIRVADKSIERLKSKVKELTKRNRGVKLERIVKELNLVITGWANYFHLANCWLSTIRDLDGWIRRTQIFAVRELNDKNKVQSNAISFRLRCCAPLRIPTAFFLQILSRRCRYLLIHENPYWYLNFFFLFEKQHKKN